MPPAVTRWPPATVLAGVQQRQLHDQPGYAWRLGIHRVPTAARPDIDLSAVTVGSRINTATLSQVFFTVTLTIAGRLRADRARQAVAAGGVATFTNLVIDAAGSYTVAASDGSLPGATSNSFSISAAAESKVVYGVSASNVTAGVAREPRRLWWRWKTRSGTSSPATVPA